MEEEEEMVGRQFNSFEELESSGGLSQWCEKYIATVAISVAQSKSSDCSYVAKYI